MRTTLAVLLAAGSAWADGPSFVLVTQGRLYDANDRPVEGLVGITFHFLASPVHLPGETPLWSETYAVTVHGGFFAVELGNVDLGKPLPAATFSAAAPLYLEIELEGDTLGPRLRVGTVAVAATALDVACTGCIGKDELGFSLDVPQGGITSDQIGGGAITADKLGPGAVTDAAVAAGLDGGKLKPGSVPASALAGDIGSDLLAEGIDGAKIAAGSLPPAALSGPIPGALIAAPIDGAKLADGSVPASALAGGIGDALLDAPIDGAKLKDGSVTSAKLAPGIEGGKLQAGSVPASALQGGIGDALIAPGLDGAKLKPASVPASALAQGLPAAGLLPALGAPPASPAAGQLYFDTQRGYVYAWTGSAWKAMSWATSAPPVGVITQGLLGWWKLDEGSGNPQDASGRGNHATFSGSASWASTGCKFSSCVRFTGGGLVANGSYGFNAANQATFAAWVNFASPSGYDGVISNNGCCLYRMMADPGLHPFYNAGQHADVSVGSYTFTTGQWHHYAMTIQGGGNITIYVNGAQIYQSTASVAGSLPAVSSMLIGAGESIGTHDLNGYVNDARVYDRVLTASEILAIYNGQG